MSPHEPKAEGALGISGAMRQVELLLRQVADRDIPLLITGESGVGKEVAAKLVHRISPRADEPFVAVNCGAIPNDLIESQLFGHEKGAFTSAQARHHGYVERAGNGILFLDEVGELPMLMQVKLLRLVQERTFTPVGGETPIKTGARIIRAANTDLEAAVAEGLFRQDLYYQVNVIPVAIPPLRDRGEDILSLAHGFLRDFAKEFRRDVKGFTADAEQALLNQPWPGNVRQLRNCIERVVALSQAPRIGVEALFPSVLADVDNRTIPRRGSGGGRGGAATRRQPPNGRPDAPAPLAPDPVRPTPRSGGAAAPTQVTDESLPDAVARRTVSPTKTRDFSEQRRPAPGPWG
jgi:DNA-binding NtrC family response regulator